MDNDRDNPFSENKNSFSQPPQRPGPGGFSMKRIIIVLVSLLVLGGIGFGAALILSDNGNEPDTQENNGADTGMPLPDAALNDVPDSDSTKTFKADFPRIEFTYPGNWIATADTEQEDVRIESPEFNYTSMNGSTVKGNFRIYIRQGARPEDSKYIGRAVASLPSEKLAYVDPPSGQRPETNLSFFGLDTSDNFAFFMIVGNFVLDKDQSLGPDYGTEPETYIITGGYSSNELSEDLATNQVPLNYFSTTNAYKQATDILKSLKLL